MKSYGEIAYEKYRDSILGSEGSSLKRVPRWSELNDVERAAWDAAGQEIARIFSGGS